jgi:hypothetical protein
MLRAEDGFPLVGVKSKCLGVRPSGPNADVDLNPPGDETGYVLSNRKGLSVSADWRELPGHLIPEHLDDGTNGASGRDPLAVFVHGNGTGPFAEGKFADGLELIFKERSQSSGLVCPEKIVLLKKYQADLAATRGNWVIDET